MSVMAFTLLNVKKRGKDYTANRPNFVIVNLLDRINDNAAKHTDITIDRLNAVLQFAK